MTKAAPIPFVFRLHQDLLLHVFHLNTCTEETEYRNHSEGSSDQDPIIVSRRTSQVCQSWRQIILGSPVIWGSMIDLRIANTPAWAEEVMSRIGGAHLSIYGYFGHNDRCGPFLTSLIVNHWHRVRRLDVLLSEDGIPDNPKSPIDKSAWKFLWIQPAPNLEEFILADSNRSRPRQLSVVRRGPLFADSAPVLRRFHCTLIPFDHNATWISHLSSVTLSKPLTTSDVLAILSQTVQLESLVIQHTTFDPQAAEWTEQINLPRVIRIHIERASMEELLVYLRSIVLKPECAFVLSTRENDWAHPTAEQLAIFLTKTRPYAASFFRLHDPTSVHVSVTDDMLKFILRCYSPHSEMTYLGLHPRLELNLQVGLLARINNDPDPSTSLYPVFGALSTCSLDHISQFNFQIERFDSSSDPLDPDKRNYSFNAQDPDFLNFLMSLSAVKTLIATDHTLANVNDILTHLPDVFPLLNEVEIKVNRRATPFLLGNLALFLSQRKAAHVPVLKLHIIDLVTIIPTHWLFLDGFDGLIVDWDILGKLVEYKCGSGGLECLNI